VGQVSFPSGKNIDKCQQLLETGVLELLLLLRKVTIFVYNEVEYYKTTRYQEDFNAGGQLIPSLNFANFRFFQALYFLGMAKIRRQLQSEASHQQKWKIHNRRSCCRMEVCSQSFHPFF
jgi:hypothetical protein